MDVVEQYFKTDCQQLFAIAGVRVSGHWTGVAVLIQL